MTDAIISSFECDLIKHNERTKDRNFKREDVASTDNAFQDNSSNTTANSSGGGLVIFITYLPYMI